jgi:hypothetical protein
MTMDINPKLEQIAELLDQALQSEDQRVKDALRALLTITVLCSDPDAPKALTGPFKTLIDDVTMLKKHIAHVENKVEHITDSIRGARAPQYYGSPDDPARYYSIGDSWNSPSAGYEEYMKSKYGYRSK